MSICINTFYSYLLASFVCYVYIVCLAVYAGNFKAFTCELVVINFIGSLDRIILNKHLIWINAEFLILKFVEIVCVRSRQLPATIHQPTVQVYYVQVYLCGCVFVCAWILYRRFAKVFKGTEVLYVCNHSIYFKGIYFEIIYSKMGLSLTNNESNADGSTS